MADRCDLEQNIMSVWTTKEDVELLLENILKKELAKDEIVSALKGISSLHNMRSEKLFDVFSEMVSENKFVKFSDSLPGNNIPNVNGDD